MKAKAGLLFNCCLFLLVLTAFAIAGGIKSDAAVKYSDNNTIFSARTKQEVAKHYSEGRYKGESYEDGNEETYYSKPASIKNPYSEGELTDDTLKAMKGMTDFYRWLVGSEEIKEDCVQTPSLQYQALDRNFYFAHSIDNDSKPEDMSEKLWKKGFKPLHNVLAYNCTPQGAITAWMNEGYNLGSKTWDTLGHRYALIHPQHNNIQYGYCGRVAIGVYDFNLDANYSEIFSAFPSAGYMPNSLVSPYQCAWSVTWNTDYMVAKDTGLVTVTVTNSNTGTRYSCTESDGTASVSSGSCSFVQPSDYTDYRYTDAYTVKITGLKDVDSGENASLTYHVKFFEVEEYADSYVKTVHPEGFDNLIIYKTMNDTETLKKAAAVLSDKVIAIAETGRKVEIPVKGEWVLDEENQCYTNYADESELPDNLKDKKGLLKKIKVKYTISDDNYDLYNSVDFSDYTPKEHDSGWVMVYRTLMSSRHSKVFKITQTDSGAYSGIKKFDSAVSEEYDTERSTGPYSYFNIDSFEVSDSGEYLGIYFSDKEYDNNAYLSSRIENLNVSHLYIQAVTPPTCTEQGYTTHTCEVCGDTYVDSQTDALGHSYKEAVTPPTCTEQGYTTHTCEVCGDTYVDSQTDALGHSYKEDVTPPTCTEQGYTTHTCEVCGDTYVDSQTDALGHSYKEDVTPPTCTEQGYTTHTCEVCGDTYVDSQTDALGHSYKEDVTPPTCTERGYTTHTCEVCGDTYVDSQTDALGHSYKEDVTPPTCTERGYTTHTCEVCGDTYIDSKTDALGHSYKEAVTPPTCTERGYTTHTCEVCGDTYIDSKTDALGHSYKEAVTPPTCTERGYTTHTCEVCGDTYVDSQTDALGHSYKEDVTPPTCTERGYTTHTCEVCDDTYVDSQTDALGHSYRDEVIPPTYNEKGYTIHICEVCGNTYTDSFTKALRIAKIKQTITVKTFVKTVKASKLKNGKVKISNAITVKKAHGTVDFVKIAKGSSKYLTINKKGVIAVKKGKYKKNTTLKMKVKVTAEGNNKYRSGSKTVTLQIKVK